YLESMEEVGHDEEELHHRQALAHALPLPQREGDECLVALVYPVHDEAGGVEDLRPLEHLSGGRECGWANGGSMGLTFGSLNVTLMWGAMAVPMGSWYPCTSTSRTVRRGRLRDITFPTRWTSATTARVQGRSTRSSVSMSCSGLFSGCIASSRFLGRLSS